MSKARITYRFEQGRQEPGGRKSGTPVKAEKVIPLFAEEYSVKEEPVAVRPDQQKGWPIAQAGAEEISVLEPMDGSGAKPGAEKEPLEFSRYTSLFEPHDFQSFTSEFSGWTTQAEPESESDRVERAIRESRGGSRAGGPAGGAGGAGGPADDERDAEGWSAWSGVGGEAGGGGGRGPWVEPETGVRYARSGRTPWLRIATSIAGAVVTGVAFGFFVLSLFSGNGQQDQAGGGNAARQATVQASAAPGGVSAAAGGAAAGSDAAAGGAAAGAGAAAGTGGAVKPAAAGSAAAVQIAAKSYAFLQNGVFSSLASAQAAQAELKKKGLASALEQSDKLTVFVGFAQSRDDALALSQQLQDKQLEVYIKSLDIPAASQIRWSGAKPEAVGGFVGEADKLVQTISGLTVVHLAESSPTALDDATLQTVRASHQAMTKLAPAVNEGIGEDVKPFVQQMTTAASSAVQSMEEYKKNPSAAMLWQAQSSMMQMIIAEKALMKQIAL